MFWRDGDLADEGEDDPEGLGLSSRRRRSALETIKKALAEREVAMPQLAGYPLHKVEKILSLAGVSPERIRLRVREDPRERGLVMLAAPN